MKAMAVLVQVDARAVEALERIATAQLVVAAVTAVIGLLVIGTILFVLMEMRAARRHMTGFRRQLDDLKPAIAPLIDRAKHVTDDVAGMTDNVRRKVDDILHTVEDLHRTVKRASAATDERVRRFAAVLDVVQAEAEELLLDAAATARGVHETARALREPRADAGSRRARQDAAARSAGADRADTTVPGPASVPLTAEHKEWNDDGA
jgi:uncharacterized protein YoxC